MLSGGRLDFQTRRQHGRQHGPSYAGIAAVPCSTAFQGIGDPKRDGLEAVATSVKAKPTQLSDGLPGNTVPTGTAAGRAKSRRPGTFGGLAATLGLIGLAATPRHRQASGAARRLNFSG